MDAVIAAADVVGRSGGREFQVGYLYDDDEPPPGWPPGTPVTAEAAGWYATARWRGALLQGEGPNPAVACERLAARILHGGLCIRCRKTVNLVPEQGRWADGNCNWYRDGQRWLRGCDDGAGRRQQTALNEGDGDGDKKMREPYETLLGHYRGHWAIGKHLGERDPDFEALFADPLFASLSTSEQKMLRIALAVYNGDREARVADLAGLDRFHLNKVLAALHLCAVSRLGMKMADFRKELADTVEAGLGSTFS